MQDLQGINTNQETYRTAEKRRVRYLSIDAEALRATRTVTPAEMDARYNESKAQFTTVGHLTP